MFEEAIAWLTPTRFESITIALMGGGLGALAGAWGGARAAQRISDRVKGEEAARRELREIGAAIQLALRVIVLFVAVKRQSIVPLVAHYRLQQNTIIGHVMGQKLGYIALDEPVELGRFDYEVMEPIEVPVDWLSKLVVEEIDLTGRGVAAALTLCGTTSSLNLTIRQRNELVAEHKANKAMSKDERVRLLFGLPHKDGAIDLSYLGAINGLERQIDDCIFFCKTAIVDLGKYAKLRQELFKKKWKKRAPAVPRISLEEVGRLGLVPPDSEYADWLRGFPPARVAYSDHRRFGRARFIIKRRWRDWHHSLGWRPQGIGKWRKY